MNDFNYDQNGFQNEPLHCPRCGAPITSETVFCGNCGLQLLKTQKPEADVLSVGDYILMMLIFSMPIAGLVMMLFWGFGSQVSVNRKNFARAYLVYYVISLVLSGIVMGALGAFTATVFESGTASLF